MNSYLSFSFLSNKILILLTSDRPECNGWLDMINYQMEGKLILGYWAIRGLSERIRQLLEYLGLPYAEERYEGADGRKRWFEEDKPKLAHKNPALTLPYLIDGEKVVSESDAILIYLCHKAHRLDLLGRSADEQVQLATAHGVYKDFHPRYIQLVYGSYKEGSTFEQAL